MKVAKDVVSISATKDMNKKPGTYADKGGVSSVIAKDGTAVYLFINKVARDEAMPSSEVAVAQAKMIKVEKKDIKEAATLAADEEMSVRYEVVPAL